MSARLVPYLVNNISLMYKRTFNMRHKVVSLTQYNNKKSIFFVVLDKKNVSVSGSKFTCHWIHVFPYFFNDKKVGSWFYYTDSFGYSRLLRNSFSFYFKGCRMKETLGKRNMPKENIFFALLVILFYYSVWISFIILPDSKKYNWHSRAANFSNQITLPRTIV